MTIDEAAGNLRSALLEIYDEGEASAIAGWVMEYITGSKSSTRQIQKQEILPEVKSRQLEEITIRLLSHEPLQYVLNEAWFFGMKFYVDKNVLIPRPETEELVDWVISNCKFPIDTLKILDVGTGSGCIPIALKRRLGKAAVSTCDISPSAITVAKKNATLLGAQVDFYQLDFLISAERDILPKFDIVISNPPYIPSKERHTMNKNVTSFEPGMALFVPDEDPLVFYRALADFGQNHLSPKGIIYAEIFEGLGKEVKSLFESMNYTVELKEDISGKQRMIRCF